MYRDDSDERKKERKRVRMRSIVRTSSILTRRRPRECVSLAQRIVSSQRAVRSARVSVLIRDEDDVDVDEVVTRHSAT